MKIGELKEGIRKVNVEGKITEKEEPREINTKFGRTQVSNATLEDELVLLVLFSGEMM